MMPTLVLLACLAPLVLAAAVTPATQVRWVERHPPAPHTVELGLAFGVLAPPGGHGLVDDAILAESDGTFFQKYRAVAQTFELRLAYFPTSYLGVEAEGGLAPTYTRDFDERADLFGFRGHLVGQLPWRSVTAFLLAGGGLLATRGALGDDIDPALHLGLGTKLFLNDRVLLRLEIRDALAAGLHAPVVHYVQVTIGLSLSFRRIGARRRITAG